ncbi:MAG: hypothetical protein EP338_13105 [Bacteroidetes bacterium]|nr:MAG: hypothetical protein EP338_13105 [Bacteroidota bacterium]
MIEALYALFWTLLIFLSLKYFRVFKTIGLGDWDLSVAFLIKVMAGAIYIFIYSKIYGTHMGDLNYDASNFLYEGKLLNDLFYKSPTAYFKLFFNIGEQSEIVQQYLNESIHWSRGNLMLINDAKNLVKIHSLIEFFSFNNIYVHFIIFNFISLVGLRNIYLAIRRLTLVSNRTLFFAVILLPSALFWGSSVLKEPLVIFGIGLLLRCFLDKQIRKWKVALYLFIACVILIGFKPYILLCVSLAIAYFHFAAYFLKDRSFLAAILFVAGIFSSVFIFSDARRKVVQFVSRVQFDFENIGRGGVYAKNEQDSILYYFSPETYPNLEISGDYFYVRKQTTAYKFRVGYKDQEVRYLLEDDGRQWQIKNRIPGSDSYIRTNMIGDSFRQLIWNIPQALNNALLRPYFTDPGKNLKYFASAESILLFAFLILAFFKRRHLMEHEKRFILSCLMFVGSLSLIIGWTTPVLGAIVRYRMPAYFVLLLIGFILIKPNTFWKKVN